MGCMAGLWCLVGAQHVLRVWWSGSTLPPLVCALRAACAAMHVGQALLKHPGCPGPPKGITPVCASVEVQVLRAFGLPCDPGRLKEAYRQATRMYHPGELQAARMFLSL